MEVPDERLIVGFFSDEAKVKVEDVETPAPAPAAPEES